VLKGSTIAPKNLGSKECKELEKIKKELATQDDKNGLERNTGRRRSKV
jgi:hypothetical protein